MHTAHTFSDWYHLGKARLVPFLVVFFAAVFVTYLVLYIVDFYPEPVSEDEVEDTETVPATDAPTDTTAPPIIDESPTEAPSPSVEVVVPEVSAVPTSMTIDALGRTVPVLNPATRDFAELDAALTQGVVRHPDSADFQNTGNMLILGHSSYLPNVMNKNFQAFNGIQKLEWGDIIRVQSADTEYVYRVDRVYEAPASEIYVPVGDDPRAKLTLATCNVFGAKEDRYIVEATLVEKVALSN